MQQESQSEEFLIQENISLENRQQKRNLVLKRVQKDKDNFEQVNSRRSSLNYQENKLSSQKSINSENQSQSQNDENEENILKKVAEKINKGLLEQSEKKQQLKLKLDIPHKMNLNQERWKEIDHRNEGLLRQNKKIYSQKRGQDLVSHVEKTLRCVKDNIWDLDMKRERHYILNMGRNSKTERSQELKENSLQLPSIQQNSMNLGVIQSQSQSLNQSQKIINLPNLKDVSSLKIYKQIQRQVTLKNQQTMQQLESQQQIPVDVKTNQRMSFYSDQDVEDQEQVSQTKQILLYHDYKKYSSKFPEMEIQIQFVEGISPNQQETKTKIKIRFEIDLRIQGFQEENLRNDNLYIIRKQKVYEITNTMQKIESNNKFLIDFELIKLQVAQKKWENVFLQFRIVQIKQFSVKEITKEMAVGQHPLFKQVFLKNGFPTKKKILNIAQQSIQMFNPENKSKVCTLHILINQNQRNENLLLQLFQKHSTQFQPNNNLLDFNNPYFQTPTHFLSHNSSHFTPKNATNRFTNFIQNQQNQTGSQVLNKFSQQTKKKVPESPSKIKKRTSIETHPAIINKKSIFSVNR